MSDKTCLTPFGGHHISSPSALAPDSQNYLNDATQENTVRAEGYHTAASCNTSVGRAIDFEGHHAESGQL